MRKLLSLLVLACCAIGASAQDWTARTGYPQDRTVVIADFSVTNGDAVYEGNWTIGAFVGDECRLVTSDNASGVLTTMNGTKFLQLEIPGNYDDESDEGEAITIKVANSMGEIYTLTSDQTLTWKTEYTYGVGSGPRVQLSVTLPASVTLSGFSIEVGNSVDLTDMLNVSPANAQLPENIIWYMGDRYYSDSPNANDIYNTYATISGSELTANRPYLSEGENQPIPYGFVIDGGNYMPLYVGGQPVENASFYIEQLAQTLSVVTTVFSVIIDDRETLTTFMRNNANSLAYTTDPAEITEEVKWQLEDATYIEASQGSWTPIKGGSTHIRPYIEREDGNLYPEGDKWITVTIIVPVEQAYFDWPEQVTFKCNVGDEGILEHLAQYIKILPLDATDRTYTITDNPDYYGSPNELGYKQVLQVYEDNTIEALAAGYAQLTIQPQGGVGGEDLAFTVDVEVFDPLKEVSFTSDPLTFDVQNANTTLSTITSGIRQNILWQDDEKTLQRGTIQVEGVLNGSGAITGNGPVLTLDNTEIPKGESIVTIVLGWNDYSSYDGTEASIVEAWNDGQSFTVTIYKGLDHFEITVTPNDADPTTGTATLTPVPADADFDWADYQNILVFAPQNYDSFWTTISHEDQGEGQYTYEAYLPGLYTVTSQYSEDTEFEVPAKVSFSNGWQWKSNPYGTVRANKDLRAFFGKDLVEARTYDKLLYNDPEWGYWGSLYDSGNPAISQAQMYKVKMGAALETFLYGGTPAEWLEYNVVKGWNWIGSPYFYKRTLDRITTPVDGMIVVGKTGSAEYDASSNTWSGDLKTIDPGQGYYVYMPDVTESSIILFEQEAFGHINQMDEEPAGARAARPSVWSYDHSRFANNLTMVAQVSGLEHAEKYTIGAFVDGECRGEGIFQNGMAFITVHTDGGEQVSFQLHNELTDEYLDIDQTVTSGARRLGSLKAPVQMTSQGVVTGINDVQRSTFNVQRYDLGGRTVGTAQKGLSIERAADGKMRKVIR